MPYTGFRAPNTDQSLERFVTPTMARKPNQTSTIEAEYFADAFGAARLHGEENPR